MRHGYRVSAIGRPTSLRLDPARRRSAARHPRAGSCQRTAVRRWVLAGRRLVGLRPRVHTCRLPTGTVRPSTSWSPCPSTGRRGRSQPVSSCQRADFVSSPRVRDDQLAWTQWDHPRMPCDGTELWVGTSHPLAPTARRPAVADSPSGRRRARRVGRAAGVGGRRLPGLLSDRTGWWNPWRDAPDGPRPVVAVDAEIGGPQWVFGLPWYGARTTDGRIVRIAWRDGLDRPVHRRRRRAVESTSSRPSLPSNKWCRPSGTGDVSSWGPPRRPSSPRFGAGSPTMGRSSCVRVRPPRDLGLGDEWISTPEPISFPSAAAHRPRPLLPAAQPGPRWRRRRAPAPAGDHPRRADLGGSARLDLALQFWTSRGFAVVDVNYGAPPATAAPTASCSTGQWGIVDVEDCVAARPFLADRGDADPRPPGHPRRQRRRLHHPRRARPSATCSPPAPATTASPTSRCWPTRPTSSRAATSTGSSGPYPEAATSTWPGRRSTTPTASIARSSCSRASRTRSSRRTRPR